MQQKPRRLGRPVRRVGTALARGAAAPGALAPLSDLLVASGMAFLAGATDIYGLRLLRDLFVSFMSGNTTMLGLALGHGDWPRAGLIALLVGLFVAGAAAGAMLGQVGGRKHAALVAFAVATALATALFRPDWSVACFVLGMGTLNAAISHVGDASVSLTYVTGTLVKFGQGMGRALCGQPTGWTWLWQAPMWGSLLAGGVLAVLAQDRWGLRPWPLLTAALLLSLAALAHDQI